MPINSTPLACRLFYTIFLIAKVNMTGLNFYQILLMTHKWATDDPSMDHGSFRPKNLDFKPLEMAHGSQVGHNVVHSGPPMGYYVGYGWAVE